MKITYFGHSTFLLETSKSKILFDPFINPNSLVQEIRTSSVDENLVSKLDPKNIECDYMLITHGHEDHLADADEILKNTGATVVSNFEIATWFNNKGFENFHPMNHGGSWEFEFGTVKYVNAVHTSSLPDGSYGGQPGGFVIQADGKTIYYAGDTALTYDMKLLAEEFDIDWALLPVGDNFTMGPKDAAKAAEFIDCENIIAMHFDTFGFIKVDHEEVKRVFKEKNKNVTLMNIGEIKELN